MGTRQAEWSIGKDPDVLIEIWSTSALIEAVLEALLEEPEKLQLALRALRPAHPAIVGEPARRPRGSSRRRLSRPACPGTAR